MIFYLYGTDTYRSREQLGRLKTKFLADVQGADNTILYFDGKDVTFDALRSELVSGTLFSSKKMLVIENFLKSGKKEEKKLVHNFLEEKDKELEDAIIFLEDKEDGKKKAATKFEKFLAKQKYAYEFNQLSVGQLKGWAMKKFEESNVKIETDALDLLVNIVGTDLWTLSSEVDKLVNYAEGKKVAIVIREMVSLFVRAKTDDNIFQLIDAISLQNTKKALELLNGQIESGVNEIYIHTMITRQFRILLQVKTLSERGPVTKQDVASRLKLHPFVAQKAIAQVQRYTLERLVEIYDQLVEIDVKLKSTSLSPLLLFDQFLVSHQQR